MDAIPNTEILDNYAGKKPDNNGSVGEKTEIENKQGANFPYTIGLHLARLLLADYKVEIPNQPPCNLFDLLDERRLTKAETEVVLGIQLSNAEYAGFMPLNQAHAYNQPAYDQPYGVGAYPASLGAQFGQMNIGSAASPAPYLYQAPPQQLAQPPAGYPQPYPVPHPPHGARSIFKRWL